MSLAEDDNLLITRGFRVFFMHLYAFIKTVVKIHGTCHLNKSIQILCTVSNSPIIEIMLINYSFTLFVQLKEKSSE